MPSWIADWFGISKLLNIAVIPYNLAMGIVRSLLTTTPETFSNDTWTFIVQDVGPWFLGAGVSIMNFFFIIGYARSTTHLKENLTFETTVELLIKIIVANAILVNLVDIIRIFLNLAAKTSQIWSGGISDFKAISNIDVGGVIIILLISIFYFFISFGCGLMILIEVLARFANIFLLIIVAPIALSTLVGGKDIENSAYAWIKSFLATTFQIVIITLMLVISSKISNGLIGFITADDSEVFSGFGSVLINMALMIFTTINVKKSEGFMQRVFNLR